MAIWGVSLFYFLLAIKLNAQIPDSLDAKRFDGNNIGMWVWNNGWLARDTTKVAKNQWESGLEWPIDSAKYMVHLSGLWLSAFGDKNFRVAIPDLFISHYLPGPIDKNGPKNPIDPKYRVYKITRHDLYQPGEDYLQWPVDLGAPLDSTGRPFLPGNQTLWTVFNDANPETRNGSLFSTNPLSAEIRCMVFDLNGPGLENVVFCQFEVVNKSPTPWDSLFISMNAFIELGFVDDNLGATDTTLMAVYAYNATDMDNHFGYGKAPPAVGYILLRQQIGDQILPRRFFSTFIANSIMGNVRLVQPGSPRDIYLLVRGIAFPWQEIPIFDPTTGERTLLMFTGDPVLGSGWLDSYLLDDRAFWATTGPYQLAPSETIRISYAICIARGESNLDSIVRLRETLQAALTAFQNLDIPTGIHAAVKATPKYFELLPNYPNPFFNRTIIKWRQKRHALVVIKLYDINGKLVRILRNGTYSPGQHFVEFATEDLSSGLYFCVLQSSEYSEKIKMIKLK
ncbi:MAG: T9SS C-terminal target domain-containing protein [Calditrichaeota bacterium]|nr:MAG: T9SS C-terminal target domain-containing protein [Calditrichota bacterium]